MADNDGIRPTRDDDAYTAPVTASDNETERFEDEISLEQNGTADTQDAEQLPQEFEDEAEIAEQGNRDRDEERLLEKERQLENELEVTDADEEGLEGHIKELDFSDDDDLSGVEPVIEDEDDLEDQLPR
ncbi:hypothetical protein [Larsenimonas suaedae]|uniref:Serine kinase/phosphatase n=1 Tax=Larsenimonas suaedae TaxID=1851019 RepID=A0ABU1GSI1_9GAMM|nr:hypothetical protein [Larsenimonas suaedae]MCM2972233.1 hypothetical protein [Larsenimonas suaedae]MDR5894971.1 hypothetical protein [Larsenimonas suaedae]